MLAATSIPASVVAKQELQIDTPKSGAIHAARPQAAPSAKLVSIRVTKMDLGTLNAAAFGDLETSQR